MIVVDGVAKIFDNLKITRRFTVYFTLWITWTSLDYSFTLVHKVLETGNASLELAGIIAAILVPVSGLQAAAIKFYNSGREN